MEDVVEGRLIECGALATRGRCLTTWPMEGNIGWAGTGASPSENLACILGTRFKPEQAGPV